MDPYIIGIGIISAIALIVGIIAIILTFVMSGSSTSSGGQSGAGPTGPPGPTGPQGPPGQGGVASYSSVEILYQGATTINFVPGILYDVSNLVRQSGTVVTLSLNIPQGPLKEGDMITIINYGAGLVKLNMPQFCHWNDQSGQAIGIGINTRTMASVVLTGNYCTGSNQTSLQYLPYFINLID